MADPQDAEAGDLPAWLLQMRRIILWRIIDLTLATAKKELGGV
jgi:hypothetical protein